MNRLGAGWVVAPSDLPSDLLAAARVVAELAATLRRSHPGADVIVGGRSVLVLPDQTTPSDRAQRPPRRHTIEVCYDGPDLESIAAASGIAVSRVIDLHAGRDYTALLTGFLPGFAYLAEVDARIARPRLPQPRSSVPRGAVGIAGRLTAVYPFSSPGGWNLVGVAIDPPPLDEIAPLDTVTFVPRSARAPSASVPEAPTCSFPPALLVKSVLGLATVQDAGRFGFRHRGVPWSGPLDAESFAAANAAVGNPTTAAAIEVAMGHLRLSAQRDVEASIDGAPARLYRAGDEIHVDPGPKLTAYVAFRGGVDVPAVFASRSTLVVASLGGRPLRRSDALGLASLAGGHEALGEPAPLESESVLQLAQLVEDERLTHSAAEVLLSSTYVVSPRMDRVGVRVEGPPVPRTLAPDLALPDPVLPGCVQITADGTPVILGPDSAVTGGYPVIGVLSDAARARLGRLRPGARVRFQSL